MAFRSDGPVAKGVAEFGDFLLLCLTADTGIGFSAYRSTGRCAGNGALIPGVGFRLRCMTNGACHAMGCGINRSSGSSPAVACCLNCLRKNFVAVIAGDFLGAGFRAGCCLDNFYGFVCMLTGLGFFA